jgi:nucleoside 2-deoxyribosyltransferase
MRIDLEEHNDKIDDRIISEIRRSGLVVADFTGQRGGVYFESGFAMGLGIPVIRTCRKDNVDTLHFDTRQYSHVLWESPEELKEKLTNRIRATFPLVNPTK